MESDGLFILKDMFPDISEETLVEIYSQCESDLQQSIEILLVLRSENPSVIRQSDDILLPPSAEFFPPEDEELPPEVFERIKHDIEVDKQEKLKLCKEFDKEMQKALSASVKQLKVDKKKEAAEAKKNAKVNKGKKVMDSPKANPHSDVSIKKHSDIPDDSSSNPISIPRPIEESKPMQAPPKPLSDPVPDNTKKISFGQKLKNIFKKKEKPIDKNLDIEIPDIKH